MKRSIPYLALALALAAAMPAFASGPGFDCAKASRQIDKAICAWDTVGALDGRMAAAYRAALAAQEGEAAAASVKAGQKAWLAGRDERCGLERVTPRDGSEEGLDPREFGQLLCLQAIYPPRIAQLVDIAAPPLVPLDVGTVPVEPLRAAYPDDWRQAGYQAQFSPDKTLMALGVEDDAGYVMQVWLYEPASGRLVVASPRTHAGAAERPEDISDLNSWFWGDDGRFYVLAERPRGEDGLFGAGMDGYAEVGEPPADIAEKLAAAATPGAGTAGEEPPPGFDDDSYDEQKGGVFTAWAQNRGHGSFDLMVARAGEGSPRTIASGGWELRDFLLDPGGTRLFYNGEDGIVVTDPAGEATRRLEGTRGSPSEIRPINLSADGGILVYSASGSCTGDAAEEAAPEDDARRVCLAYLAPAEPMAADAMPADPWVGTWRGGGPGSLSAVIRRGTARPDYLVIDLLSAVEGCSGAVTLYGKPEGATVLGESYDPDDPSAPVCRVELSLDGAGGLKAETAGACAHYHGASCGFDGSMSRGE